MLFRPMKKDGVRPVVADTATGLGLRARDYVADEHGRVGPGRGGISVCPHIKDNIPDEFLVYPIWVIDTAHLEAQLTFRQDSPTHGVIEAAASMSPDDLRMAIVATREVWVEIAAQAQGRP